MDSSFGLARAMRQDVRLDPRAQDVYYAEVKAQDVAEVLALKVRHNVAPHVSRFLRGDVFPDVETGDFLAVGKLTAGMRPSTAKGVGAPNREAWEVIRQRYALPLAA